MHLHQYRPYTEAPISITNQKYLMKVPGRLVDPLALGTLLQQP